MDETNTRVAVVGAGSMGGAIALGLARSGQVAARNIWVTNPSMPKLQRLKNLCPDLQVGPDNREATVGADVVVLAVKPWLVQPVLAELDLRAEQTLVSVAAGVSFAQLRQWTKAASLFRVIPNTAIAEGESMTLIAADGASADEQHRVADWFGRMGRTALIPENQMGAATALASCGIAYALKYVQAAMQAGVEMGLRPQEAMQMAAQAMKGAAELLLQGQTHPAVEIDKVTTPGGLTIRGLNELEHAGFASAVIRAMKASR